MAMYVESAGATSGCSKGSAHTGSEVSEHEVVLRLLLLADEQLPTAVEARGRPLDDPAPRALAASLSGRLAAVRATAMGRPAPSVR